MNRSYPFIPNLRLFKPPDNKQSAKTVPVTIYAQVTTAYCPTHYAPGHCGHARGGRLAYPHSSEDLLYIWQSQTVARQEEICRAPRSKR